MSIKVDRYGRIVLPKHIREKYGVREGSRLIVREFKGQIILIPVRSYGRPTRALYGSVRLEGSIDNPKCLAKGHMRKKLADEM